MKKFLLLFLLSVSLCSIKAAPFKFLPYKITQPSGEVIECFVSGDEFFNWIHDKDGYTIIQGSDGYFYYATQKVGEKISPSSFVVGKTNPEKLGIKKWIKISARDYESRKKRYDIPSSEKSAGLAKAPHTGTLNNIVIYIKFADDAEIQKTRESYDNIMNSTTAYSLKSYYNEVSYGNLSINSTHYPTCDSPSTTNASYQDSHNRNYFRPYNATTNPIGYSGDSEARDREHQLLYDAVTWINTNSPVDSGLDIDADGDGNVDNVCFMIKGNSDGWSDLLWAHRWVLYSKNVSINGKRVYDYTFQPESQVQAYVLCHEMFHALGAPDLYHYNENNFTPVGAWDIMEAGRAHMGAYMKWKYANAKWITEIPEIKTSGTYTLNPLTSSTNNCYKIVSPNSDKEFFVLEFRKKEGTFENYLPGSGLIVYRINTDFEGNADFDNSTAFDEVYIYRPSGTTQADGYISSAHFSSDVSRTSINDATSPSSFLHDGMPGGLDISNITSAGSTISFDVYISDINAPANFTANGVSESQIDLSWTLNANNDNVLIAYSTSGAIGSPARGTSYSVGSSIPGGGTVIYSGNEVSYNHEALSLGTTYSYKIWSVNSSNEYSSAAGAMASTNCADAVLPITEGFNNAIVSPCWSVISVAQGETQDESASITQVQSSQYPSVNAYEGSHMIRFNSAMCGAGNIMRLASPVFSTVGKSQVNISFAWHRDAQWPNALDYMTLQWSTDGSNWTNGATFQRYYATEGWSLQSYTLPSEALEHENLQIGFQFTSAYGYNCYLDNLKITASTTGINSEYVGELMVYPNPSKGMFTLELLENYQTMIVEVYDMTGRNILSNSYNGSAINYIDMTNCSKGIYLMRLKVDGKIANKKIVLE
ncbi:MAG: M6 family metalloprotease domain-containing protein [Bacteroidales bacterium]